MIWLVVMVPLVAAALWVESGGLTRKGWAGKPRA